MSYDQCRELVLALITSGRLPVTSFDPKNQSPNEWASEVLGEFNKYVELFTKAEASTTVDSYRTLGSKPQE